LYYNIINSPYRFIAGYTVCYKYNPRIRASGPIYFMFWSPNIVYVTSYTCYKHCTMLHTNKRFVFSFIFSYISSLTVISDRIEKSIKRHRKIRIIDNLYEIHVLLKYLFELLWFDFSFIPRPFLTYLQNVSLYFIIFYPMWWLNI
jgi:hypothetical protein